MHQFGDEKKDRTKYLSSCLALMGKYFQNAPANQRVIGVPYRMAAGMAGGDWMLIQQQLVSFQLEFGVTVVIHVPPAILKK
jgi:hypothetical protein